MNCYKCTIWNSKLRWPCGHRSLEFHIVHLLEPAPQTQTATAYLQTTWTVYFDRQGTQKLPCGNPPPSGGRGGGGEGGGEYRLAHGLFALLINYSLILAYRPIMRLFSTNSATMLMPTDVIYSWHHHALSNKNILKSGLLSTVQTFLFVYHLVSLAKFTHTTEANILLG